MKYKRLFLGICLTLLMVISQAQERVLPKFKLGGALRFNYNFCDWKPGHRDRGGDFGFDVLPSPYYIRHPRSVRSAERVCVYGGVYETLAQIRHV